MGHQHRLVTRLRHRPTRQPVPAIRRRHRATRPPARRTARHHQAIPQPARATHQPVRVIHPAHPVTPRRHPATAPPVRATLPVRRNILRAVRLIHQPAPSTRRRLHHILLGPRSTHLHLRNILPPRLPIHPLPQLILPAAPNIRLRHPGTLQRRPNIHRRARATVRQVRSIRRRVPTTRPRRRPILRRLQAILQHPPLIHLPVRLTNLTRKKKRKPVANEDRGGERIISRRHLERF